MVSLVTNRSALSAPGVTGTDNQNLQLLDSFPVQNEVGRVGTNSSSYILPVAERKDGIASFFKKQEAKGVPVDTGSAFGSSPSKTKTKAKVEKSVHVPVHTTGSRQEIKQDGLDDAIGDDSNAPNSIATTNGRKPEIRGVKRKTAATEGKQRSSLKLEQNTTAISGSSDVEELEAMPKTPAKKKIKGNGTIKVETEKQEDANDTGRPSMKDQTP